MHRSPVLGEINRRWAFATCSECGFEPRPLASPVWSNFQSALTQERDICPPSETAKVSLPLLYSQAAPDWEDEIRKLWRTPELVPCANPLSFQTNLQAHQERISEWKEGILESLKKLLLPCRVEGTFYVTTKSTISEESYLFVFLLYKRKCSYFRNG